MVPKVLEEEVKSTHENGHFGVKKMEEKITQSYFISRLKEKLPNCVKHCVPCIVAENKCGKGERFLHPIDKHGVPL